MSSLSRPLTLVTGASYGLGYGLALQAAKEKHHVLALGRTQSALDQLANEIDTIQKGTITIIPMDVTDDDAIAYMASMIIERWGKLNFWMHTVWFQPPMQPSSLLLPKDLDKAFHTNIRATARLIAMLNPILRESSGTAVAFNQKMEQTAYMAPFHLWKNGQITLFNTWAEECQNLKPDVKILTPNRIAGNIQQTLYPGIDSKQYDTPQTAAEKLWPQIVT